MAPLLRSASTASCLALALVGLLGCDAEEGRDDSLLAPELDDEDPGKGDNAGEGGAGGSWSMRPRVLVYEINPIIHSQGERPLHEVRGWNDPQVLASQYRTAVKEATWGAIDYEIVEAYRIDQFPLRTDGKQYDEAGYLRCLEGDTTACLPDGPYMTDLATYMRSLDWCGEVDRNGIDEVWVIGAPYFGLPESQMAGSGAYWLNSDPLKVDCGSPLVIMAFSSHVPVGNMLHNLGHRIESHMEHAYSGWWEWLSGASPWKQFSQQGECGNTHWPPNADIEYAYDVPTPTMSGCDGWLDFPAYPADPKVFEAEGVSCWDWGCSGDTQESYMKWWIQHLPHDEGESDGYETNWYRYVFDYRAHM